MWFEGDVVWREISKVLNFDGDAKNFCINKKYNTFDAAFSHLDTSPTKDSISDLLNF